MTAVEAPPNRYWKVMTPREQRQRVRASQAMQASVERKEIKAWKQEEVKRAEIDRLNCWQAKQPSQQQEEASAGDAGLAATAFLSFVNPFVPLVWLAAWMVNKSRS